MSGGGSLVAYFAATFAATWAFFFAAVVLSSRRPAGAAVTPGIQTLVLFGAFMPALVALAFTARAGGRAGVKALLARLFRFEVSRRWYAFAVLFTIAIRLAAAVLYRLVAGAWPRFGFDQLFVMVVATVTSTLIGGQAGEEIGWRGHALPRLAGRFGLAGASLVLGAIWALWHLPLYYLHPADKFGQSFPVSVLQVCGLSVAIAWVWWKSGGSLLLTMLMHAAINNTKDIVPTVARPVANPFDPRASLLTWLTLAVLWVAVLPLLFRMRGYRREEAP